MVSANPRWSVEMGHLQTEKRCLTPDPPLAAGLGAGSRLRSRTDLCLALPGVIQSIVSSSISTMTSTVARLCLCDQIHGFLDSASQKS